jgi:phosphate:Na+ symporter
MEIYECILSLIAGIGVFILAMKLMSESLNQLAGEKMKNILAKLSSNRILGVITGALVTAVIQSSSATTVMVIGFVNCNVMDLNQAAAIIIGSNIGTTVTGLLASLESLNISLYLSLLVFLGVMLAFIKKIKKFANLMAGLGMIFVGLKMMSSACNDKSIKDAFQSVLEKISFPLLLEILGVVFTAIIQSSSAMTGIVIIMVLNKVMNMKNGLFITLGANVGTCVTALLGIIGANTNSKRTAIIHLIFNITGCIIFTPVLWILGEPIISLLEAITSKEGIQIAIFHLAFNICTAIIMTPLIQYLVKIANAIIKDDEKPEETVEGLISETDNLGVRRSTTNNDSETNTTDNNIINTGTESSIDISLDKSKIQVDEDEKEKLKKDGNEKYEPPKILVINDEAEEKDKNDIKIDDKKEEIEVKSNDEIN